MIFKSATELVGAAKASGLCAGLSHGTVAILIMSFIF
jgi:hypothetical protein